MPRKTSKMNFIWAAIVNLLVATVSAGSFATTLAGPVHDPQQLLSDQASIEMSKAAEEFKALTGRLMVVAVSSKGSNPEFFVPESMAGVPVGIVYSTTSGDKTGRLLIVDPAWQKTLPAQWSFMFPQRLAQKYGAEPFEQRVVLSAQYLARVFTNKLAFVLKPRGGKLNEGSANFSRSAYIGIEILGYFIIAFTAFRTFWPAHLRDEDTDDFSNELRRLKKERQIW